GRLSLRQNQCGPGRACSTTTLPTVSGGASAPAMTPAVRQRSIAVSRGQRARGRFIVAWEWNRGALYHGPDHGNRHTMVVVTNRIPIARGHEIDFEDRFKRRVHLVDRHPGFVRNEVHRPRPMKFEHERGTWVEDPDAQGYYEVKTWWRNFVLRAFRNWDFPKGLVESDEQPLASALREACEEAALDALELRWGEAFRETEPYAGGKVARYYVALSAAGDVRLPVSAELG